MRMLLPTPMPETLPHICILGGGFGGLYTALQLNQLPWNHPKPIITLIDHHDRFLFTPLLYELVTEELQMWEIAPPYEELLSDTPVRFCQADVTGIDLDQRQVTLNHGTLLSLTYDRLVLALGGETPTDNIPGAAEYALAFRSLKDAYLLKQQLRWLEASTLKTIRVAVVGASYSGVELACKLAKRLGDRGHIQLIQRSSKILPTSFEYNRQVAQKALSALNVFVSLETSVVEITPDHICLNERGETNILPIDLVLWTVGTRVNQVVTTLPLRQTEQHQVMVKPTLESIDWPGVYALGDLANFNDAEGRQVAGTAQVAVQQADYAGWNIWASLCDRPQLPFRYYPLGEMLTLGTDQATLCSLGLELDGVLAHIARRMVYLLRMPTLSHQMRVGLNWMTKPLQDLLLASGGRETRVNVALGD